MAKKKAVVVGRNMILSTSQTVAGWLSDLQEAIFFVTASILFLVSQIMSAPCSYWFFQETAGKGLAAIFFAVVMETAGGYAAWEYSRRRRDNALTAKKWQLPVILCQIAVGISVIIEGFIIWAYMIEHGTTLKLLVQLGITDMGLFVALGYMLSLVGVLLIGLHGQRIYWNLMVKRSMEEAEEAEDAAKEQEAMVGTAQEDVFVKPPYEEQVLTVDTTQGEALSEWTEAATEVKVSQPWGGLQLTRQQITPLVLQVLKEYPDLAHSPTRICRRIGIPVKKRTTVSRIVKEYEKEHVAV